MCIAIYKAKGVFVPEDHLRQGFKSNSDGCGLAWVNPRTHKIETYKSMDYLPWFNEYTRVVEEYNNPEMLIHFRITSKGKTTLDNCHPFVINNDMAMIHNGTITKIHVDTASGESDTAVFARDWLGQLPKGWEDNEPLKLMIEDFIGWSKIVILHRKKGPIFLNESKGVWNDDHTIWYSNKSYETYKTTKTNNYNKTAALSYYGGRDWDDYDYPFNHYSDLTKQSMTNNVPAVVTQDDTSALVKCNTCGKFKPTNKVYQSLADCICYDCFDAKYPRSRGHHSTNFTLTIEDDDEYGTDDLKCHMCGETHGQIGSYAFLTEKQEELYDELTEDDLWALEYEDKYICESCKEALEMFNPIFAKVATFIPVLR